MNDVTETSTPIVGELVTINEENTELTIHETQLTEACVTGELSAITDGIDKIIEEFQKNPPKLTTKSGRGQYKSMASKISRSKTKVSETGINLAKSIESQADEIMAKGKLIRKNVKDFSAEMDKKRDAVKAPAIEWDKNDAKRKTDHQFKIEALKNYGHAGNPISGQMYDIDELNSNLEKLTAVELTEEKCEEFLADYTLVVQAGTQNLTGNLIPASIQREEARKENERLRKENARIAEETRAQEGIKSRINSEFKVDNRMQPSAVRHAEMERINNIVIDDTFGAMKEHAQEAKTDSLSKLDVLFKAAEKAEAEQKIIDDESRERQAADQAQRVIDENNRKQAAEDEKLKKDAADRAADKEHRKAFNREALAVIMEHGNVSQDVGVDILKAIISGKVPHVKMEY